jgi:hypothetical protein
MRSQTGRCEVGAGMLGRDVPVGISSPAGPCRGAHRLQRSVREWAIRHGWGGRPVDHKAAGGILIAALGVLAAHLGYGGVKRAS